MNPKLWLTYAWVDNEDNQVDYIYHELGASGVEVRLDKTHIRAGKRLWPQIDELISSPDLCDAWAIYATKHSLESQACQEEIAYALDRALRSRGSDFPLIGIFPEKLDRKRLDCLADHAQRCQGVLIILAPRLAFFDHAQRPRPQSLSIRRARYLGAVLLRTMAL